MPAIQAVLNRLCSLEELLDLLVDHVVDLLGEGLNLFGSNLATVDNLARGDVELSLNGSLHLLDGGWHLNDLGVLGFVATTSDDLGVVGRTSTVEDEKVLSVARDVGESALGGNTHNVILELLWADLGDSVVGVDGWLQRQVVGQETSDVRGGHGSTRDGIDSVLGPDPGGKDVESWSENVVALSVVGEVSALIRESGSTNGDSLLSSSWRVVARIGVVITGSDGKMETGLDGTVHSSIECWRFATSERHVGGRALEALGLLLAILSGLDLLNVLLSSPFDTLDDIGHGSRSVGSEDLNCVNVGLLGDTVLLTTNSTGAVSSVSVSISILVASWDGLAPVGTTLKVDVLGVGSGVNDIDINTLSSVLGVEVLVEGGERETLSVGDTSKTPWGVVLGLAQALLWGIARG